jgi:hypothetical protein
MHSARLTRLTETPLRQQGKLIPLPGPLSAAFTLRIPLPSPSIAFLILGTRLTYGLFAFSGVAGNRDQYAAVPPAAAHDRSRSGQQSTNLGYNYNANNRANWVDDRTYNGYTGYTGR